MIRLTRVLLFSAAALALVACNQAKGTLAKSELDEWADNGTLGGAFAEMRKDFPQDFEHLKTTVGDGLAKGEDHEKLKHETFLLMRNFASAHTADQARAPVDELVAIADQQGKILAALQKENVQACGDFSMSAMREGTTVSKATEELVGHAITLQIHAARAGADHPTVYPPFDFTPAERTAFVARIRAAGIVIPAGGLGAASSDVQCQAGVITQQFMVSLPHPRIAAFESAAVLAAGKAMAVH